MTRKTALAAAVLGISILAPTATLADTSIQIAGSTALLPLVKDASGAYQSAHPDVKISVAGGGSGTGINQVASKAVDIGDSDILAKGQPSLVDHRVAVIMFAVVAHPGVGVKNLTKDQVQKIFSGAITNWKQVGGADQKIVVVNRPRSSGTRAVFTQTMMGTATLTEAGLTEDATGTVVTTVKTTPGAVSYAAYSGVKGSGLTEMSIDGVSPNDADVETGKYPIWSYEHMFTNGPGSPAIESFISYVSSQKDLVQKSGYILISDMKVKEVDR